VKITNETKIGLLAFLAVILLIFGFNFLKGKNVFANKMTIYAKYNDVSGLTPSNPVFINGLQVGIINSIDNTPDLKSFNVAILLNQKIDIPNNSIASIIENPLASTKLNITLGDTKDFLKNEDTIATLPSKEILSKVMEKVNPVIDNVVSTVSSLDSVLSNANKFLNKNAQNDIAKTIENLNKLTTSLLVSSSALQSMLTNQTGAVAKTLNNINSITENLSSNNNKVNRVFENIDKTTTKLSQLEIQNTLQTLDSTILFLNKTIEKINSKEGTLGLLVNDKVLYNNLTASTNKINILLDDIRTHPKRYVSISVFGKKEKESPLLTALPDTLDAPYILKH